MPLRIRPSTQEERKQVLTKIILNKTNKVSKIADNSVLAGTADGVAKIAGKAEKDIILAFTRLYPESASGIQLDESSLVFGVSPRFTASGSSTYLLLRGDVGTVYPQSTTTFVGRSGVEFELEQDVTIPSFGFTYAKVRSIDSGIETNIDPGDIDTVNPQPTGHQFVTNEYQATGGKGSEDDLTFRRRIQEGANILATQTLSRLEQAFILINPNVLRVFNQGLNAQGQIRMAIATQNGINLNASELDDLLKNGERFFALTELKPFGTQTYGIELVNIDWQPIDISFRIELFPSFNLDEVRKNIQVRISKYLDFRKWIPGEDVVEWDDLLGIVKSTRGVKYVADQNFFPRFDIPTDRNKLPRLRGFRMLSLQGNLLSTSANNFNPVFFPNQADFSFQQTALRTIT